MGLQMRHAIAVLETARDQHKTNRPLHEGDPQQQDLCEEVARQCAIAIDLLQRAVEAG